jgi:hypothetical protein
MTLPLGNQMGRVSGKILQMSRYLLILVNLAIKVLPVPFVVNIERKNF